MPTSGPSSLTWNTSAAEHQTSQSSYRTSDQSLGCKAVLEDLPVGRYRVVSDAYLVCTVFGPAPSLSHVSRMRNKLEDAQVLKNGRWTGFPCRPCESTCLESDAFQPLLTLISHIFSQVEDRMFSVAANPSMTSLSERKDVSRPDAYIYVNQWLADEENRSFNLDKMHWFDIALSFEFKKANTEKTKHDDNEKMIWNLHHVMREDPRRRFALGITIEDTQMRLWCHSRAMLAVSVPIDFLTSIDKVVSLFYLIGSRTYVQLGWDPTVERICKNGKIQYKFNIRNELFTTTRAISTFRADAMVGGGTRVYEAVDEKGKIVAIKDSWRDECRDPEGLILQNILEDIKSELGDKEANEAKQYFVAIRVWEDVSISGVVDKTFDLGRKDVHSHVGYIPGLKHLPLAQRGVRARTRGDDVPRRIHTRTVFVDVGPPLMNITCLSDSLTCLSDGRKALHYLHKTGWLHRDFSITNVLWLDGRGKLTDLEYAKKVGSHDVRIGTLDFMALEVEVENYRFQSRKRKLDASEPPFRMNFLHDLESEWWAAIWLLFHHTDKSSPSGRPDEQSEWYHVAFPEASVTRWQSRLDFFASPEQRRGAAQSLSDTYQEACIRVIMLADDLHDCYREVEKSYPDIKHDNSRILDAVHRKVSDAHSYAKEKLSGFNIQLEPLDNFLKKDVETGGVADEDYWRIPDSDS